MRRPEPLTPVQRLCAGVIAEFWRDLGRSPSFRELLHELDRRGWLEPRRRGQAYALRLTADTTLPPEEPVELTAAGRAVLVAGTVPVAGRASP